MSHEVTPPHLTHPGWHLLNTHMHRVTLSWRQMQYTGVVGSQSQPITVPITEHGGTAPCSRGPRPWQGGGLPPLQLSVHQSFLSCESGTRAADLPVIGRPNLTNVSHGRTNMVCDLCHLALTGTEQLKQRNVKFSI